MKMMKKNGGFTLVELIVVIAILAILAGVAIPAYSGYIKKAKDASVITELDAIQTAAQAANATAGEIDKITVSGTDASGKVEIKVSGPIKAAGSTETVELAKNFDADFTMFFDCDEKDDTKTNDGVFVVALDLTGTSYENGATWYAKQQKTGETVTAEAGWNADPENE